jgi:hypothetical protein
VAAKTKTAGFWIDSLKLQEHPEGGYFKETYRSETQFDMDRGARSAASAIYYLLKRGQFSAFHRIKSDELWHFYAGGPLAIHVIDQDTGKLDTITLGRGVAAKQEPQAVVRAGCWFAAEPKGAYSLVGCTVSPGFDFADWEVGSRGRLLEMYPKHRRTIERLAKR